MPRNCEVEYLPKVGDLCLCHGFRQDHFTGFAERRQLGPIADDDAVRHVCGGVACLFATDAIELIWISCDLAFASLRFDVIAQIITANVSWPLRVHQAQTVFRPIVDSMCGDASNVCRFRDCVALKGFDPADLGLLWHVLALPVFPRLMAGQPIVDGRYLD
jgi:hypothetical protein